MVVLEYQRANRPALTVSLFSFAVFVHPSFLRNVNDMGDRIVLGILTSG